MSHPLIIQQSGECRHWDKTVSRVKPAYEQRVASLKEMSLSTGDSEELHMKASPWQRRLPDLPEKLLQLVSSPSWGWFVAAWPLDDNMVGTNDRDLNRIKALLDQLDRLGTGSEREVETSMPIY